MTVRAATPWMALPGALLFVALMFPVPVDSAADAQRPQGPGPSASPGGNEIKVLPVQGDIYMLVGGGANITASVGDDGVLLVDAGSAASSTGVLAAVRSLSAKPVNYIINTSFLEPHTGGNEALAKAGRVITDATSTQAIVLAHENVLNRMSAPSGQVTPRPVGAWPTDTFFTQRKDQNVGCPAEQTFRSSNSVLSPFTPLLCCSNQFSAKSTHWRGGSVLCKLIQARVFIPKISELLIDG